MKSIQSLHDTADKERAKSASLRQQADKERLKAQDNIDNPQISMEATNNAQKYEEKAAVHDQTAAVSEREAVDLEAKALEINRRKNEIQASSQAEIDRLDQEERALRGESRGLF